MTRTYSADIGVANAAYQAYMRDKTAEKFTALLDILVLYAFDLADDQKLRGTTLTITYPKILDRARELSDGLKGEVREGSGFFAFFNRLNSGASSDFKFYLASVIEMIAAYQAVIECIDGGDRGYLDSLRENYRNCYAACQLHNPERARDQVLTLMAGSARVRGVRFSTLQYVYNHGFTVPSAPSPVTVADGGSDVESVGMPELGHTLGGPPQTRFI